jgi:hypothetical protein
VVHKETPCVATFISNKQNVILFFFLLQSWRTGVLVPIEGESEGKERRRVNAVQKQCTHVCK